MMNDGAFVIERTFNAPVAAVWKAITDKDEMKKWYFDLPDFRAEVGFEFHFSGGPEDRVYRHVCTITEVVVGQQLTYSWRYEGYEGVSYVTFELFAEDGKTRVKLTHAGLETFPANNPDFARGSFEMGWTDIIGRSLKGYLKRE